MKKDVKHLLRLAQAQLQLARSLESRILSARQELSRLHETQAGTMAALDRAGPCGLVVYAAAMRKLVDLEAAAALTSGKLKEMDRKLVKARGREDILLRRARKLTAEEERLALENETRDSLFAAKARGKPGMVE